MSIVILRPRHFGFWLVLSWKKLNPAAAPLDFLFSRVETDPLSGVRIQASSRDFLVCMTSSTNWLEILTLSAQHRFFWLIICIFLTQMRHLETQTLDKNRKKFTCCDFLKQFVHIQRQLISLFQYYPLLHIIVKNWLFTCVSWSAWR
jgi:hypothetical protein